MLKNLKVRTKLAIVLLVPLIALVAIGAVGVLDRRAEAGDAREDKQVAELLAARVELTHQLQIERIWLSLSGSSAISEQLGANQAALDAARQSYERRAATVRENDPALTEAIDAAATSLTALDAARPAPGRPATAAAVSAYDAALDGLSRVGVAAGRAGGQGELGTCSAKSMNRLLPDTTVLVCTPGIFLNSAIIDGGTASIQSTAPVLKAATRVKSSGMTLIVRFLTVGRAVLCSSRRRLPA